MKTEKEEGGRVLVLGRVTRVSPLVKVDFNEERTVRRELEMIMFVAELPTVSARRKARREYITVVDIVLRVVSENDLRDVIHHEGFELRLGASDFRHASYVRGE